jgi:hypothetical protein
MKSADTKAVPEEHGVIACKQLEGVLLLDDGYYRG